MVCTPVTPLMRNAAEQHSLIGIHVGDQDIELLPVLRTADATAFDHFGNPLHPRLKESLKK